MLYPINEVFYSIQGEGFWSGRPAIFIRFAGCNLTCGFCDTTHDKVMEATSGEVMGLIHDELPEFVYPLPMVVLTGGEPTIHDLSGIISVLRAWEPNLYIALETNGTLLNRIEKIRDKLNWICVSPKLQWRYNLLPVKCDELKVVFEPNIDPGYYMESDMFIFDHGYIQPLSGDIKPALEYVKKHPDWKLSVQIQKLIGEK